MTTLTLDGVCHSYARHRALDHVSSTIGTGVCGLIGENGAGKSTLLGVCSGAQVPTSGHVLIDGVELTARPSRREALRRIAFMPQSASAPGNLSVLETVTYLTWMRGTPWSRARQQARQALALVDLEKMSDTRCKALSGGMQRRVWLAQTLASEADVLLLDEPSTGLDPRQRQLMLTALHRAAETGATIVLSSHVLEDVADLADHLVVLTHGTVAFDAAMPESLDSTWFLDVTDGVRP